MQLMFPKYILTIFLGKIGLNHFICLECGMYRWALLFPDDFLIDCFSLASICRQSKSLERGSCNHYFHLIKSWGEPEWLAEQNFPQTALFQHLGSDLVSIPTCQSNAWPGVRGEGRGAEEGVNALAVTSPEVFQCKSGPQTKSRFSYFKLEH